MIGIDNPVSVAAATEQRQGPFLHTQGGGGGPEFFKGWLGRGGE